MRKHTCNINSFITKRKAFTLVELLIVIAIIGILFIVLVSKVDFATDKAKATGVQTDFRNFQLAFNTVANDHAGFNTFGWDTGDANQDGIRNSYDEGDNGAGGGIAQNGIQDGAEVFTGRKVYNETFTKVFSLKKNGTGDYDREALNRLETAINANLDPKLHITIQDDGEIVMANGAKDPWNNEYHGWYISNAEVDGLDRGAIVMYSNGADGKYGSEHSIANGIVTISIPGSQKTGKDDYSIVSIYTYVNGYGEIKNSTVGFSSNLQFNEQSSKVENDDVNIDNDNNTENDFVYNGDYTALTPGLYAYGSNYQTMTMTWDEIIEHGLVEFATRTSGTQYVISSTTAGRTALVGDLVIPNNLGITHIGSAFDYGFEGCAYLTGIVIPDGVIEVSYNAFKNCCNLKNIHLPDTLTTLNNAFYLCTDLTQIVIPASVTEISNNTFGWCCNLVEIINLSSVEIDISTAYGIQNRDVFNLCSSPQESKLIYKDGVVWFDNDGEIWLVNDLRMDEKISTPVSYNGQSYKVAQYTYAFSNVFKEIVLSDNIQFLGNELFRASNIETVRLPNNVVNIGETIFFECDNLKTVICPDLCYKWTTRMFSGCKNLTTVHIPSNITEIPEKCFNGCSSLNNVAIPETVTTIAKDAFNGCTSLTSINVPDSVVFIGEYAFAKTSISSIVIPEGIIEIQSYTFSGCANLSAISLPSTLTKISSYAFQSCSSLQSIVLPTSLTQIGSYTFKNCTALKSLVIPNNVTEFGSAGSNVIENCTALESIVLGSSLEKICYTTFKPCTSLKTITILSTVPPYASGYTIQFPSSIEAVYVPAESVSAYTSASAWKKAKIIALSN